MNSTGIAHFFSHLDPVGWMVFVILAALSLSCWTVISARLIQRYRERRAARSFPRRTTAIDSPDGVAPPSDEVPKHAYARLLHVALHAWQTCRNPKDPLRLERVHLALQSALEREAVASEWGMTFLAITASTAPYIGLLGTVWGIYHALASIGFSGQTTLEAVAGPIGEALVMTALGLAVAIPAGVAHGAFTRSSRIALTELDAWARDIYANIASGRED